jgi:hypothetical protein
MRWNSRGLLRKGKLSWTAILEHKYILDGFVMVYIHDCLCKRDSIFMTVQYPTNVLGEDPVVGSNDD